MDDTKLYIPKYSSPEQRARVFHGQFYRHNSPKIKIFNNNNIMVLSKFKPNNTNVFVHFGKNY